MAIRVAIVGVGKITRTSTSALSVTEGAELAAIVDRNALIGGVAHFKTLEEMLAIEHRIDAVAMSDICTLKHIPAV
ncbi:MAG: hypothetical protein KGK01_11910 [Bradyrhizobium sp.]|uniref:hypothetical protein n=1 Tax=Bradyrhizobium sp. TaxID=376 RepID=UPI001C29239D|nr:hypothetical protein [Bradyrhizobium sp.]MBU6461162.1 hypothetical protein [Pseudomonadota bacterium]MDE2066238.1 hypothetical protein [Bradyrhizobium sp.]MDE2243110.1 hypothetical protein [Bradyrhizobium sp.]MDE2470370.1 hypothetical protein [Bradyrhizobium sp.]